MSDLDNTPKPFAEIEVGPSKSDEFLNRHYKKLVVAGVVLIVGIAGYVIWKHNQKDTAQTAGRQLSELIAGIQNADAGVQAQLERVATEFAKYPAGETARLVETTALWNQGKREEAISATREFITDFPKSQLVPHAEFLLGLRLAETGQSAAAREQFARVADTDNSTYAPIALMWLGDIAHQDKDDAKAREYYNRIIAEYPDSILVLQASGQGALPPVQGRLKMLGVQPPVRVSAPEKLPEVPKLDTTPGVLPGVDGKLQLTPGAPTPAPAPAPQPPKP